MKIKSVFCLLTVGVLLSAVDFDSMSRELESKRQLVVKHVVKRSEGQYFWHALEDYCRTLVMYNTKLRNEAEPELADKLIGAHSQFNKAALELVGTFQELKRSLVKDDDETPESMRLELNMFQNMVSKCNLSGKEKIAELAVNMDCDFFSALLDYKYHRGSVQKKQKAEAWLKAHDRFLPVPWSTMKYMNPATVIACKKIIHWYTALYQEIENELGVEEGDSLSMIMQMLRLSRPSSVIRPYFRVAPKIQPPEVGQDPAPMSAPARKRTIRQRVAEQARQAK